MTGLRDTLTRWRWTWRAFKTTLIWKLLLRQKRWVWGMLGLGVINALIGITVAGTLVNLIDNGIIERTVPLEEPATSLAVLSVIALVFGFAQKQITSRISYHVEYELRTILYGALQGAHPGSLDQLPTGQLITRAITDLQSLQVIVVVLPNLVLGLSTLLGLFMFTIFIHPVLAVLALVAVPINWYALKRRLPRLRALSWLRLDARAQVTSVIDENVRGIRVVKAFAREPHATTDLRAKTVEAYRIAMTRIRELAKLDLVLKAVPVMVDGVIIFLALRFIIWGGLTIGELAVILGLTRAITGVAQAFDEIADGATDIDSGQNRVHELLAAPSRGLDGGGPLPDERTGLRLQTTAISIGGGRIPAPIDLNLAPGRIAFVRTASDAVRAELVAMLTGLSAHTEGHALIDGVDVRAISPRELMDAVRIVNEEPFLFGRTLRENLAMGAGTTEVADDDLVSALAAAGAESVLANLPEGLDTVLGDRGFTLSGGERQRVALARAIVRPARVLVLNDALSAVNPALETEIIGRIAASCPATSIVVMARRPSAAPAADEVVEIPEVAAIPHGSAAPSPSTSWMDGGGPADAGFAALIAEHGHAGDDAPDLAENVANESDVVPTVRHILRPYAARVAVVAFILAIFTVISLVPPLLVRVVVDAAESGEMSKGDLAALALLGIGVATGIGGYFLKLYYGKVDEGILYLLRRRIFARLLRLPVSFYDRELPGAVATRAVRDLDVISAFVDGGVYLFVIGIALAIGTGIVLVVISPTVAVVVAGFAVLLAIVTAAQLRIADRAFTRQRHRYEDVISRLQEDFAGRAVISGFGADQRLAVQFSEAGWRLRQADRWATSLSNAYEEASKLIGALASAALYYTAGRLALDGTLSTGSVIALQAYLGAALAPVQLFSGVVRFYLAARVSLRKLQELYRVPESPVSTPGLPVPTRPITSLALDGVDFTYPGTSRRVLHDVSFQAAAGEVVTIVGPTGAGKSSVAKLLWRVYDPDDGSVQIDGVDVRDLDLRGCRQVLGVVPQDAFVFGGTIATNVAYGRPDATRDDVIAAVEAVGAYRTLLSLPGGLDAEVQEEGRNLTPEVRQLIALARVWLVQPDCLILDEATSALEPAQEQQVLDAVRSLGRTTVVIAHRPQVAQFADRVVLVQDGEVVADGPHDELLAANQDYQRLWGVAPVASRRRRAQRSGSNTSRT